MNVLHIRGHEQRGGAYQAAQAIATLLDEHSNICLEPSDAPPYLGKAWRSTFGFRDRFLERRMKRWMRGLQPDIVHLHNFKDFGTSPIYAAKALGIPLVWSCYDYWGLCVRDNYHGICNPDGGPRLKPCLKCYKPEQPMVTKLPIVGRLRRLTDALSKVDRIIALSADSATRLRMGGISAPVDVVAIPVTVPDVGYRRVIHPNQVVFAGWPSEAKGIEMFRRLSKRQDLAGVVFTELSGDMERDDVLLALADAGVLLVPEQWPNPGPLVVSEAMALGVPVIASDIGGIPETLDNRGRLVKHDDEEAWADAITEAVLYDEDNGTSPRNNHVEIRYQIGEVYSNAVRDSSRG